MFGEGNAGVAEGAKAHDGEEAHETKAGVEGIVMIGFGRIAVESFAIDGGQWIGDALIELRYRTNPLGLVPQVAAK